MSDVSTFRHFARAATIRSTPEEVFEYLDDHERLLAHMSRPSSMMGGGRMQYSVDKAGGREIGARFRISGSVLGLKLEVEEAVTERNPPWRKTWKTTGDPRLLVIGTYRMGFAIERRGANSLLRIFIEYTLPGTLPGRWLGMLLGRVYARWCVGRILDETVARFGGRDSRPLSRPALAGARRS